MKVNLLVVVFVGAAPALANPILGKCLPVAPQVCGLTDRSTPDQFLSCFENVPLLKSNKAAEIACAGELAHARVHKACDADDIPTVCAGLKAGANRIMNCLRKNEEKLGSDCRKALKDYNAVEKFGTQGKRKKNPRNSSIQAVRC